MVMRSFNNKGKCYNFKSQSTQIIVHYGTNDVTSIEKRLIYSWIRRRTIESDMSDTEQGLKI